MMIRAIDGDTFDERLVSLEEAERLLKRDPNNYIHVPSNWRRSGASIRYVDGGFRVEMLVFGANVDFGGSIGKYFDSLVEAIEFISRFGYMDMQYDLQDAELVYW